MGLTVILILLANLAVIRGKISSPQLGPDDEHTHLDSYASALARAHYSPWACDYRSEAGYKCLSCNKALHCYPANFALLVQCAGLFPFCRNGYCSRFKNDGCIEDPDVNNVSPVTLPPYLQIFNRDNKTSIGPASQGPTQTGLNEPVPEESSSFTISTELNNPNKITEEIVTSTSSTILSDGVNEKPASLL